MSLLDNALAGFVAIETAKANNPRQVQTIQQVESDRRTSINSATRQAGGVVGSPSVMFAGFDQRILIGTGALLVGLFAVSMMRK